MTHIILDCDGVLLNWESGFATWMRQEYQVDLCPKGPQSWDISSWIGCNSLESHHLIQRFNSSPEFGQLQAEPFALGAIKILKGLGHRMTVLSSCSTDSEVVQARRTNLLNVFGEAFDAVTCLPLGGTKESHLMSAPPGTVFVEDNYFHALRGKELGLYAVLMLRQHNIAFKKGDRSGVHWVEGWGGVLNYIQKITENVINTTGEGNNAERGEVEEDGHAPASSL